MVDFTDARKDGLIICEGPSDASVIRGVLRSRGFDRAYVCATGNLIGDKGGGNSFFLDALRAARVATGSDTIKIVILATDNDESPIQRFEFVRDQVQRLAKESQGGIYPFQFPVPVAPNKVVSGTNADPDVAIMMVPTDSNLGALESLVFEAARVAHPVNTAEVDTFAARTKAAKWSVHKVAKMKVRAYLACTHESKPDIPLGSVLSKNNSAHLIPVGDKCFDHLFATIVGFFR